MSFYVSVFFYLKKKIVSNLDEPKSGVNEVKTIDHVESFYIRLIPEENENDQCAKSRVLKMEGKKLPNLEGVGVGCGWVGVGVGCG